MAANDEQFLVNKLVYLNLFEASIVLTTRAHNYDGDTYFEDGQFYFC